MTFTATRRAEQNHDSHEPQRGRFRAWSGLGLVCSALLAGAVSPAAASALTSSKSEVFEATGAEQSFTVPAGVTSVRVRAVGAAGAAGTYSDPWGNPSPGGDAALVTGQLAVSPGEVLYVEVADNAFNGGGTAGGGAGAGGGASDVRRVPAEAEGSPESRLLVAGGGGGGGAVWAEGTAGHGGDAGSIGGDGAMSQRFFRGIASAGGGAGTLTAAGAGGANCEGAGFWTGHEGLLGAGGEGGEGVEPTSGGGGGGGGYFGGGGGEGTCFADGPWGGGAGGGGGSSYVEEEASYASMGLASPTTAPSVSITFQTPATATPSVSSLAFGTQPLQTVSAPRVLTLTNAGGSTLELRAESFAGSSPAVESDHPEDFLVGSSSCLGAIAFEESCEMTVRFDPQESGASTATLRIAGNMGEGPTVVALSGTGGTLPQGPKGASGTSGPQGAEGPAGARGLTAHYTCHPRELHGRYKQACFVWFASGDRAATKASLERRGVVYARGTAGGSRGAGTMVLVATRRVPRGRYTLVLVSKRGTVRETIRVR